MELSIKERILLLNTLPAEGDITTIRIVRQLREALSFSEQEHDDHGIKQEDGQIHWNESGYSKDIEFGPKASKLAAKVLKKLSDGDKLTLDYIGLYDKFVVED